jgi:hypothetical protein
LVSTYAASHSEESRNLEMKARKKNYPASRAYEEGLDQRLKSPEYAIAYLNVILEDNDPDLLLLGLRDVARAYGFTHRARVRARVRPEF